jgi:hypothetical protein
MALVLNASMNLWSMAGLRPPPRAPSAHSLSPPPGGAWGKTTRIAGARGDRAGRRVVGGAGPWGGAEFGGRWEVAEE